MPAVDDHGNPVGLRKGARRKPPKKVTPNGPSGDSPRTRKADLRKADEFKQTPAYRKEVREAYRAQPLPKRRQILDQSKGSSEGATVRKDSKDRQRGDRRAADGKRFLERLDRALEKRDAPTAGGIPEMPVPSRDELKGLRILQKQAPDRIAEVNAQRAKIAREARAALPEPEAPEKKGTSVGAFLGRVVGGLAGAGSSSPTRREAGSGDAIARRLEELAPLSDEQVAFTKGAVDATTTGLAQLSRVSSASAGATLAAVEGRNVAKGTAEGFLKNNRSYKQVAEKLGLKGTAATLVGLGGDILLDPTTYVTAGASAPAKVAGRKVTQQASRKVTRTTRKAVRQFDNGKITRTDLDGRIARALEDAYTPKVKARQAKAAGKKQGRGVQVGVRNPVTARERSVTIPGTVAAGRALGAGGGKVQQAKFVNSALTRVSAKQRRKGFTKDDHAAARKAEWEGRGVSNVFRTEAANLVKLLDNELGSDVAKHIAIRDAIEAGTVDRLPSTLRAVAGRLTAFNAKYADEFEQVMGRPLRLSPDTITSKDVGELRSALAKAGAKDPDGGLAAAGSTLEDARTVARERVVKAKVGELLAASRATGTDELAAALRTEAFHKRKAVSLAKAGNARGAAASRVKVAEARAVIKAARPALAKRAEAEVGTLGDDALLSKPVQRLARVAERLQRAADVEPVVGYVPRVGAEDAKAVLSGNRDVRKTTEEGFESMRVNRGRLADEPDNAWYEKDLRRVYTLYGGAASRRIGAGFFYNALFARSARSVTDDALAGLKPGEAAVWKLDPTGTPTFVEGDPRKFVGDPDHVLVDKPVSDWLRKMDTSSIADDAEWEELFNNYLRLFKEANTVMRPGFFVTTMLGNSWQMFLADISPRDFAAAYRRFGAIRGADRAARNLDPGRIGKVLDAMAPGATSVVGGRSMTYGELWEESIRQGVVRTGSRIGDPSELTVEKGIGQAVAGRFSKARAFVSQQAEDLDDLTKFALYKRARERGMSPEDARTSAYALMIDYSDLTKFEQRWAKRILPFWIFTSRNLPIQIKRLLERPGKMASFEKVRQAMADEAGLPSDWATNLTEGEQERNPIPVPGLKPGGFQAYLQARLPGEDLSRILQVGEGTSGVGRMAERYIAETAPYIKAFIELPTGQNLAFDRPIAIPGRPAPAGKALQLLDKVTPGKLTEGGATDYRSGDKYVGTSPTIDYLIRTFGGSPGAIAQNLGAGGKDRGGLSPTARIAASTLGGVGLNAVDPLEASLVAVNDRREKLETRSAEVGNREGRDSVAYARVEEEIGELAAVKRLLQAAVGYSHQKENLPALRREQIELRLGPSREARAIRRALSTRVNALDNKIGG